MKQVTRNIDLADAQDLLECVPRACIAFTLEAGPQAQPVTFLWHENRYLVGIPANATVKPAPSQESVLLIDEGLYFFDLRAVYIRGHLQSIEPPPSATLDYTWFALLPTKEVAWDYGTMHIENT